MPDTTMTIRIESSTPPYGLTLLREMRAEAEERGFMSDADIETEIQAAKADIKARKRSPMETLV